MGEWPAVRLRRRMARRWLRGKGRAELIEELGKRKPKDVIEQQALVAEADGLVFVAPVFWMGLPAIIKGWVKRVFTYGFAYTLTPQGWRGRSQRTGPAAHPGEGADPHSDLLHRRGIRRWLARRDGYGPLRVEPEDGRREGGAPRVLLRGRDGH